MPDPRGKPVEKYKLTDEQKSFQKRYKRLKQVQSIIEGATLANMAQAKNITQLWQELESGFQHLSLLAPPEQTREFLGMNFQEQIQDPNLKINY
jgi:hypothetical protein